MAKKRSKHYLSNKDLLKEILISKEQDKLTDKAFNMLMLLAERVVSRLPYANNYLREEAHSGAVLDLLLYWDRFDPDISTNAFSYYTQVSKSGCCKGFNISYKGGKKFQGTLISMDGSYQRDSDNTGGIYSI